MVWIWKPLREKKKRSPGTICSGVFLCIGQNVPNWQIGTVFDTGLLNCINLGLGQLFWQLRFG